MNNKMYEGNVYHILEMYFHFLGEAFQLALEQHESFKKNKNNYRIYTGKLKFENYVFLLLPLRINDIQREDRLVMR